MRVLVLHSRYLSGTSSGENRVVEDEVELLRSAGHEVRLWAPSPEDAAGGSRLRLGARAVWSRSAVREVGRLAAELRPDVVHVHNLYPDALPGGAADGGRARRRRRSTTTACCACRRRSCATAGPARTASARSRGAGVVHRCYRGSAAGSAALAASLGVHRPGGHIPARRGVPRRERVRARQARRGGHGRGPDPGEAELRRPDAAPRRGRDGTSSTSAGSRPRRGSTGSSRSGATCPAGWSWSATGLTGRDSRRPHRRRSSSAGRCRPIRSADTSSGRARWCFRRSATRARRGRWSRRTPRACRWSRTATARFRASSPTGVTGLLVDPGSPDGWRDALARLGDDAASVRAGGGSLCQLAQPLQSRPWSRRPGGCVHRGHGGITGSDGGRSRRGAGRNRRTARLTPCHNRRIPVVHLPSRGGGAAGPFGQDAWKGSPRG